MTARHTDTLQIDRKEAQRPIVVGVDGSELTRAAVSWAIPLRRAGRGGAFLDESSSHGRGCRGG